MKKRMQGQVLEHAAAAFTSSPARYSGIIHCCQTIFRDEGLMGFYRGIMPTVAKSVLATAVTFSAYEVRTVLCIYRAIVTYISVALIITHALLAVGEGLVGSVEAGEGPGQQVVRPALMMDQ